ncbi:hypothetical protein [Legionella feeleii]|uniref:Uncharacterized protein n=2 Tax=Legionella feeleii TaxID=453 RepID=A0A2X1RN41_9GAMM|nr:hypothetical protein [Legionella feeleii]SPX59809.1 Uncharacterised protein [Legionella feeleii]
MDSKENMEEGPGLYEQYQQLPANHYGFLKGLTKSPAMLPYTHHRLNVVIVKN